MWSTWSLAQGVHQLKIEPVSHRSCAIVNFADQKMSLVERVCVSGERLIEKLSSSLLFSPHCLLIRDLHWWTRQRHRLSLEEFVLKELERQLEFLECEW